MDLQVIIKYFAFNFRLHRICFPRFIYIWNVDKDVWIRSADLFPIILQYIWLWGKYRYNLYIGGLPQIKYP